MFVKTEKRGHEFKREQLEVQWRGWRAGGRKGKVKCYNCIFILFLLKIIKGKIYFNNKTPL